VAFFGCLVFGIAEGSFWSLGPVFAQQRGFSVAEITYFMSAFMLGGTLLQWPIGWISDHVDRRIMIAICCIGTIGTGLSLALVPSHSGIDSFLMAALHGGFMFPLYGLILAHANDFAPQEKLVETSGGLLLVYGVGAAIGPFGIAQLMQSKDAGYLFLIMSVLFGALALFVLIRIFIRPITDDLERSTFVPTTKSSQAIYELETDDDEEDEEDKESPPAS
jgi:MFS family permease